MVLLPLLLLLVLLLLVLLLLGAPTNRAWAGCRRTLCIDGTHLSPAPSTIDSVANIYSIYPASIWHTTC